MIKSILGGKSKNLCDVAYLLTLPVDKTFQNQGYWRVLINAEPNTTYTFSRENANQITDLGNTYLAISAYDDISHNNWLSHHAVQSLNNKSATLTTSSDGKLWILFGQNVYTNYWQKNLNPFGYIQLELGSIATEYVPHELTSYKSIMKVSDVCQLVDKSKFPNTLTKDGITLTNNGDGSITLNGTAPTTSWYSQFLCNINTVVGHKYALIGIEGGMASSSLYLYRLRIFNSNPSDFANPNITTATSNICSMHIQVAPNITVNNLNCKPQLFDLTEMFGAGNEPKTVAEFKAKFPNDYYPYSPSCFVTSFDERMPCKTKNLFSSSTEVGVPSSTLYENTSKRIMENGKWYVGFSKNNYYRGPQSTLPGNFQYNIWENSISIYTKLDGYGLAKCIYVEPNTSYILSYKVSGANPDVAFGFYQEDGTFIKYFFGKEITTPQNCKFITVVFALATNLNKVTHYFSDIQLVKGTTATDYVPYGYV